jgi:DnaK suppressor protein
MAKVTNIKEASSKTASSKVTNLKAAAQSALKPTPTPKFTEKVITEKLIQECKEKLLSTKADLLNRVKEARGKLDQVERGGDEADQTMRILAEQEVMNLTDRLRSQLLEVESALGRVESGNFGVCEETDENIETERLRAIPWTRLSIEGAEIRESMTKRYARS